MDLGSPCHLNSEAGDGAANGPNSWYLRQPPARLALAMQIPNVLVDGPVSVPIVLSCRAIASKMPRTPPGIRLAILGVIISLISDDPRKPVFYHDKLKKL
jgi:hypothetical protein